MSDFFKRNLVWISILLCVTGVVLSIVGIPTGNPIFFFVGIILSLPTIGYLIYYVFFYQEKPELNLTPTTSKISTSNITSIVTDKESVLLSDAAIEAADIVLMRDDLRGLLTAKRLACRTMHIVRQNIFLSILIKIGILALSAFGIANMWLAIFGDVGVAMLTILNAFRINHSINKKRIN